MAPNHVAWLPAALLSFCSLGAGHSLLGPQRALPLVALWPAFQTDFRVHATWLNVGMLVRSFRSNHINDSINCPCQTDKIDEIRQTTVGWDIDSRSSDRQRLMSYSLRDGRVLIVTKPVPPVDPGSTHVGNLPTTACSHVFDICSSHSLYFIKLALSIERFLALDHEHHPPRSWPAGPAVDRKM